MKAPDNRSKQNNPIEFPIYQGKAVMDDNRYQLRKCAKKLDITPKQYMELVKLVGEQLYHFKNKYFVSEIIHKKVHAFFNRRVEPVRVVNEDEDMGQAIAQICNVLKKDIEINQQRNSARFYTEKNIEKWQSTISRVNSYFQRNPNLDAENKTEESEGNSSFRKWKYTYRDKIPMLKMKERKDFAYGWELYIEFYCNQKKKDNGGESIEKIRHRIFCDLNFISNTAGLFIYALRLIHSIQLKINDGYCLQYIPSKSPKNFADFANTPIDNLFFIPTLYKYVEQFKTDNELSNELYGSMKSDLNTLTRFIYGLPRMGKIDFSNLKHEVLFLNFNRRFAERFIVYLRTEPYTRSKKPICTTTIGNIFNNLRNLTNRVIKKRDDLSALSYDNPFSKQEIEKSPAQMHEFYETKQLKEIEKAILKSKNTQLYYFTKFLYYTGLRKVEAQRLHLKYVDLKGKDPSINLVSTITKNNQPRTIRITPNLKLLLLEMGLDKYPNNYFLFSSKGKPGEKEVSRNYFTKQFAKIRLKCPSLTFKNSLYSFRHTYARRFMMEAVNPKQKEVRQNQLRENLGHSSIVQTERYLRNIGAWFVGHRSFKGVPKW